jgi:hypothetical protein
MPEVITGLSLLLLFITLGDGQRIDRRREKCGLTIKFKLSVDRVTIQLTNFRHSGQARARILRYWQLPRLNPLQGHVPL